MNVTLRQLRAIVAIHQTGSLTRAAERLGVTQSAISVLLREAERSLAARLFERTTRRLTPTAAGDAAYPLAMELLTALDGFGARVTAAAEREAGGFTFAATAAVAAALGPRLIERFRHIQPAVTVRMLDVAPEELAAPVLSGEALFSIGTPERAPTDIALDRLAEDRLSVITWPGGPFHDRESVSWRELADVSTISVRRGGGIRELIDHALAAEGIDFAPTMEARFLATALAMANQRLGVLVLPALVASHAGTSDLRAVPLCDPEVRRQVSVLRRAGQPLPAAARAFIQEARRLVTGD